MNRQIDLQSSSMTKDVASRSNKNRHNDRAGAAVVELAVFAPILVLFCFATLELTFYINLKQSLATAAYEAVRGASGLNGTNEKAQQEAERIFEEREINNASYSINRTAEESKSGDILTVTVSAPMSANTSVHSGIFTPKSINVSATMVRE